jgi:hypothetical protein
VAVSDGIDSDEGENEIAPIKNVFNEWYSRDISRKRRYSIRVKGNSGKPLGPPPYGYMKDADDPDRWVVDEEAAAVVRRVYRMTLDGLGTEQIAKTLTAERILTPVNYWRKKGVWRPARVAEHDVFMWNSSSIVKILGLQEYCGDVINFKTYSKDFKNKKRIKNDREDMMVFENVHEPVIEREAWAAVQYESEFAKLIMAHAKATDDSERQMKRRELSKLLARHEEIDGLFERIYEDSVSGRITEERFTTMSRRYEDEQSGLSGRIKTAQSELDKADGNAVTAGSFMRTVRKYTRARKLTRAMLHGLIDHIDVHHAEKSSGKHDQKIVIHWACVGRIEISDGFKLPGVEVEVMTRRGVTMSYAAKKAV